MTSCPEHGPPGADRLAGELRALAVTVLDRAEPLLAAVRESERPAAPSSCVTCPVCAVLAALRGERPELAVRLAEHATALLAVLREVVEPAGEDAEPADTSADRAAPGGADAADGAATAATHRDTTSPPDSARGRQNGAGTGARSAGRAENPGRRRVQRIPVERPDPARARNGHRPGAPDGAGRPGGPPGRT